MIKIYTILHSFRTIIKGNGILYMKIYGLDKELYISTNINISASDWDQKSRY